MICKACGSERLVFLGPYFLMLHGECLDCKEWTSELIVNLEEEEAGFKDG